MNKYQLKDHIEQLGKETLESHEDIRSNYNMGLITFAEYSAQIMDTCFMYTKSVETSVKKCMEEEQCSKDYLAGYLSNFSLTIL